MSLPYFLTTQEGYKNFQIMNHVTVDDKYGGYIDTYTPGATFDAVLKLDDSIRAQQAQAQGVQGIYTLTYDKTLRLPWHTVFREVDEPSKTYRVTSKDENSTPSVSPLDLRQVKAEEWEIPS